MRTCRYRGLMKQTAETCCGITFYRTCIHRRPLGHQFRVSMTSTCAPVKFGTTELNTVGTPQTRRKLLGQIN